ncbi:hypothetical protein BGX38DRAFT_868327 [Terfezia claveryi]|nr:hypothetical protein BGX38DRAFT_868327 [Terfezia claveryi]
MCVWSAIEVLRCYENSSFNTLLTAVKLPLRRGSSNGASCSCFHPAHKSEASTTMVTRPAARNASVYHWQSKPPNRKVLTLYYMQYKISLFPPLLNFKFYHRLSQIPTSSYTTFKSRFYQSSTLTRVKWATQKEAESGFMIPVGSTSSGHLYPQSRYCI